MWVELCLLPFSFITARPMGIVPKQELLECMQDSAHSQRDYGVIKDRSSRLMMLYDLCGVNHFHKNKKIKSY